MRVHHLSDPHDQRVSYELLDDTDQPIEVVSGFMVIFAPVATHQIL
jgi:hypothetical protein